MTMQLVKKFESLLRGTAAEWVAVLLSTLKSQSFLSDVNITNQMPPWNIFQLATQDNQSLSS